MRRPLVLNEKRLVEPTAQEGGPLTVSAPTKKLWTTSKHPVNADRARDLTRFASSLWIDSGLLGRTRRVLIVVTARGTWLIFKLAPAVILETHGAIQNRRLGGRICQFGVGG
jgi:hypothetical protein